MKEKSYQRLHKIFINSRKLTIARGYHVPNTDLTDYDLFVNTFSNIPNLNPNMIRHNLSRVHARWNCTELFNTVDETLLGSYGENYRDKYTYFSLLQPDIQEIGKVDQELLDVMLEIPDKLDRFDKLLNRQIIKRENVREELVEVWQDITSYGLGLDNVLVIYHGYQTTGSQIKIEFVRNFISHLNDAVKLVRMRCDGLFIINYALSTNSRKNISCFEENIVILFENELTFCLPDHVMVPKHELLPKNRKNQLLKELGITADRLPLIHLSDPIVKYYGWRLGDIIRVTRDFEYLNLAAPIQYYYRTIIP